MMNKKKNTVTLKISVDNTVSYVLQKIRLKRWKNKSFSSATNILFHKIICVKNVVFDSAVKSINAK